MPTGADALYNDLNIYLDELKIEFLGSFLGTPTISPQVYKLPVRAYCVLAHGGLEEYFESVAIVVMSHCHKAWLTRQVYNDAMVSLIHRYPMKINEPDGTNRRSAGTHIRDLFDHARTEFSREIHKNHGTDVKYLQTLLEPLSIDFTVDVKLLASLQSLASNRGDFAHGGVKVSRTTSPEDAVNWVSDCLKICDGVRNNANMKLT